MAPDDVVMLLESPIGLLALTREELARSLIRAADQIAGVAPAQTRRDAPSGVQRLLSAEQMADATGVPASWWERQARENRIHHYRFGRYPRFDLEKLRDDPAHQVQAVSDAHVAGLATGVRNRRMSKSAMKSK